MKSAMKSSIFSLIVTLSLRGGLALGMIVIANFVTVPLMGKIAAILTLSVTVAQIIGYPLSILVMERREVYSGTMADKKMYHDQCFSAWLATSATLFIICFLFIDPLSNKFFDRNVPTLFIICGAIWACAISLEIMTTYIAAVTNSIKHMALFSLAQAILLVSTVSLASMYFQDYIILCAALCTLISGILLRMFLTKSGFFKIVISSSVAREILKTLVGPSFLTVLALTLNNFFIIHIAMSIPQKGLIAIANFGIAMQIVSILGLAPQIIHTLNLQNLGNGSVDHKLSKFKTHIIYSLIVSLGLCGIFAMVAPFAYLIYGSQYSGISHFLIFSSLLAVSQGVNLITTQFFVINKTLWQLFFITAISSGFGILIMQFSPQKNEFYMIASLIGAGYLRMILMLISFYVEYRRREIQSNLLHN